MKRITKRPLLRNQRVSNARQRRQQNILEVRVRSRTAKQQRNRRILVTFSKLILIVALGYGLYFGGTYAARRLFFQNPDYQLSTIEVQTDGTLPREQVLQTAELREGMNIFSVNLAQIHDRLLQLPQVDEVEVTRKLPGEIGVRIVERKPVAWITSDKEFSDPFGSNTAYLVDARGVLMKQKKLLPEYLGLPVITGVTSETLEAGRTISSYDSRAALDLLRLSAGSFMQTRFQVRQIDLSRGYCLRVTDRNATQVTFAFDSLEQQIRRLEQFLVYADDSRRELATVNLMVQRNIPVTFTDTPTDIINSTVDPRDPGLGGPRIMKAVPVHPEALPPAGKSTGKAPAMPVRKAVPVKPQQGKGDNNGE